MSVLMKTEAGSAKEEARLAALQRYSILDTFPEQSYEDIARLASQICGTPISLVSLVDADRQWFKAELGLGLRETERSSSFCAHTLTTATTLVVPDACEDQRFAENPLVTGEPRIRFYAGAPVVDPDGHVLGTVCVIDTEPRQMCGDQIAALEALARQVMTLLDLRLKIEKNTKAEEAMRTVEKLSAVGRLASAVAHEINNPLQSMTNLLFMAQSSQCAEERQTYLQQSQDELARVSQIVTQTLRFHRQSEKPRPTMLNEVLDTVLLLFHTRLKHSNVTVHVRNEQAVALACYRSDLRQVLANMLGNALDAINERGEGRIQIRIRDAISASTGSHGVQLVIADNGSGMTAATKIRLFEPFQSTKGPRGTGLGLWVSKGILEKHGATVRVMSQRSERIHGTVFSIFFPLLD